MEVLKNILRGIWRVWFYVVAGLIIIILLPVLVILTSNDRFYPAFYQLARFWAKIVLFAMGFKVKLVGENPIIEGKSYMFSANHTSMIDVFVMLKIVKYPMVFVGKKELVNLPIFGFFYKRTCILVDRGDAESRKQVYQSAQNKINKGFGICIFPEGMVPSDESIVLHEFKNGVFSLAIEHKIPIVPMVFYDCKKRFSYTTTSGSPGELRVKILNILETEHLSMIDKNSIRKIAYEMMYNELIADIKKNKDKK
jgi:1-acyl-sn-glycerol-3-phosphate acyltransferase